jgi:GT2 family glycosyltransferase
MDGMTVRPLVSIVTPTFNRTDKLVALLESVRRSDYPADCLEVIIVDNAADPKLAPVITPVVPGLTVITPGRNLYSNAARKLGAELARGQYLFFLDDDNTIARDCISELIDALETHTTLGAVCPIMLNGDTDEIWCAGARLTRLGTCVHLYQSQSLPDTRLPKLIEDVEYLPNACMVRTEALLAAPLEDGSLPHNWSEIDFGLRILRAGYGLACVTSAIDRHHMGYSGPLTRLRPETVYDQARSRLVFRKRYYGHIADWLLFWGVIYPASSVVYFRQMVQSSSNTWSMLRSYVRGTLDGIGATDRLGTSDGYRN